MAEAVVNAAHTFQVLFVDDANLPMGVNSPTISVFSFSQSGVKQVIVNAQPMVPVQPVEIGRYTYVLVIPGTYTDGDTLYAEMRGLDPGNGNAVILVEESLTVIAATRAGGVQAGVGMRASFVKGG